MSRKQKDNGNSYNEAFPSVLRELMKNSQTTQNDLAKYLGKSRQSVSYYCDGSSSPDWRTISAIARFFSVSADYLLGLQDQPSPDINIKMIRTYTGLSEAAISNLHMETFDPRKTIDAINRFLESDFLHNLAYWILQTLRTKKIQGGIISPKEYVEKQTREFCEYESSRAFDYILHSLGSLDDGEHKED